MSSDVAISINKLGKFYKIYNKPNDRLKQVFLKKKFYKEYWALKNVTLDIGKGETIAIIGKNGSGKSTLLQIIAGTLSQTEGEVVINGRIAALLELGSGFNPDFTGIENIYFNGAIMGFSKKQMDDKLESILSFADIGEFANQPVKTYSSGMFARLAFAVAINVEPDILIVDEALSVGDIFFQQKCNIYMKEKMQNITKILVTHDMATVAKMADRAIVLNKGEITFCGHPLQAIEYYIKNLHSESFIDHQNAFSETSKVILDSADWIDVAEDDWGGALEAKIMKYKFLINDKPYTGYIQKNDILKIDFLIVANRDIRNIIYGYLANDKYGNIIFGDNSITSGFDGLFIQGNRYYQITMEIKWPEVKDSDYFITLGVGEGEHEFNHIVQCWAHNVIRLSNINPNRTIHGIFNNAIDNIEVNQLH